MRKYLSYLRIHIAAGLQYRAAAWAGIATQFAWGFLQLKLYLAFHQSNPAAFPMTFAQTASYIWLQQATISLFFIWFWDNSLFEAISSGAVAYELLRPFDLYTLWMTRTAAFRLSRGILRVAPIVLFAAFLPAPFGLMAPPNWPQALAFALSLILAFLNVLALSMFIYIAGFHMLETRGLRLFAAMVMDLLSGSVVPLPFFPDAARAILERLPFAMLQNVPLRIYSGHISGSAMGEALLLQAFWLIVMTLLGRAFMKRSISHVVVQGG